MAIQEPVTRRRESPARGAARAHRGGGLPWPIARVLGRFAGGRLDVVEGALRHSFGDPRGVPLAARVEVHDRRTWRALLLGGTIGAAEAYAEGWWSADDLTALVRLVVRNERTAAGLDGWLSRAALAVHTASHRLRGNRRLQSRRGAARRLPLRLPRHDDDDLRRAVPARACRRVARRSRGADHGARRRLPRSAGRRAPAIRQAGVGGDDRGGRTAVSRPLPARVRPNAA